MGSRTTSAMPGSRRGYTHRLWKLWRLPDSSLSNNTFASDRVILQLTLLPARFSGRHFSKHFGAATKDSSTSMGWQLNETWEKLEVPKAVLVPLVLPS